MFRRRLPHRPRGPRAVQAVAPSYTAAVAAAAAAAAVERLIHSPRTKLHRRFGHGASLQACESAPPRCRRRRGDSTSTRARPKRVRPVQQKEQRQCRRRWCPDGVAAAGAEETVPRCTRELGASPHRFVTTRGDPKGAAAERELQLRWPRFRRRLDGRWCRAQALSISGGTVQCRHRQMKPLLLLLLLLLLSLVPQPPHRSSRVFLRCGREANLQCRANASRLGRGEIPEVTSMVRIRSSIHRLARPWMRQRKAGARE